MGLNLDEAVALASSKTMRKLGIERVATPEPMIAETTINISNGYAKLQGIFTVDSPIIVVGNRNRVIFDGVAYDCETKDIYFESSSDIARGIGNASLNSFVMPDTGEPFFIKWSPSSLRVVTINGEDGSHTIEIQNLVETITPIDPKYLPGVVVDFDEIGLTNAILSLLNSGGGSLYLPNVDGGAEVSKAMCKAFPLGRNYVAKLTVLNMGAMYVNPVYTLFDDYGFKVAHFDSYTENAGILSKFYVRLYRNAGSDDYSVGMITVGFY